MFNLGPMELVVVVVIVLIFFGPKRLPALAKSIAESVKSFKSGLEGRDQVELSKPEETAKLAEKVQEKDKV